MKKVLYLSLVLPLIIISCEKSPVAQFSTDTKDLPVGQEILFHNESSNATDFEWDFGDGFTSHERDPYHTYNSTGTYDVSLTAIGKKGGDDVAKLTINVVVPTLLVIEVREYYEDYVVPDASVLLYNSLNDWNAADVSKAEIEGFTDANGIAVFANLDPFVYYVDVWEKNHDNVVLGMENVDNIRTPEVMPHQINWFLALVDKANHSNAKGRASKDYVIKKLVRVPISRVVHPSGGTEGWQELYQRRVNK